MDCFKGIGTTGIPLYDEAAKQMIDSLAVLMKGFIKLNNELKRANFEKGIIQTSFCSPGTKELAEKGYQTVTNSTFVETENTTCEYLASVDPGMTSIIMTPLDSLVDTRDRVKEQSIKESQKPDETTSFNTEGPLCAVQTECSDVSSVAVKKEAAIDNIPIAYHERTDMRHTSTIDIIQHPTEEEIPFNILSSELPEGNGYLESDGKELVLDLSRGKEKYIQCSSFLGRSKSTKGKNNNTQSGGFLNNDSASKVRKSKYSSEFIQKTTTGINAQTFAPATQHSTTQHSQYICGKCSFACSTSELLSQHVTSCSSFRCDTCGKMFKYRRNLTRHKKSHSIPSAQELNDLPSKVVCYNPYPLPVSPHPDHYSVCTPDTLIVDKSKFTTKLPLKLKEKIKPVIYKCSECPKTFSRQSMLLVHTRIHTGERPFKCSICGQSFTHQQYLSVHFRVHTGEKRYQCTVCKERFAHRTTLVVHERTHTGEKPYRCEFCEQRFAHRTTLVIHLRTHTGENPYKCDKCNKAFTNRSNLVSHRKVHSDA